VSSQRGNVTIVVVAAVVLAGLLCLAVARLGGAAVDKARANTAADAAALAAAGVLARGGTAVDAVRVARSTASANGATLTRCRCSGTEATVDVRVNSARSRARAQVTATSPVTPSAREGLVRPTLGRDLWH
jgi:secretion/DNA translocation related TadE-like protein